jgi:hypothetical protein
MKISSSKLIGVSKKTSKKFTQSEKEAMFIVLVEVLNSLQKDEDSETYVDGGRITLSLVDHRVHDIRMIVNKLYEEVKK